MGTGDPGGKADAERVYTRHSAAWHFHDPHNRVTRPGKTQGWDPQVGQSWPPPGGRLDLGQ